MKFYKFLLRFIQIFVVLVVLPRVASFVGLLGNNIAGPDFHDLIRFAFAATLGLGTIATAYFSDETEPPEYDEEPHNPREKKRREREAVYFAAMRNAAPYARRAMYLFAFLDGTFNLADAFFWATRTGLLDPATQSTFATLIYGTATVLFGISPTILAIVLSRLISMVDRIPADYEKSRSRREVDMLRTVLTNMGIKVVSTEDVIGTFASPNDVRYANASEPNLLPNPDRTPNVVRRANAPERGEQATRIMNFLDENTTPEHLPTIPEIQLGLGDPIPSKSTISVARSEWLQRRSTLQEAV